MRSLVGGLQSRASSLLLGGRRGSARPQLPDLRHVVATDPVRWLGGAQRVLAPILGRLRGRRTVRPDDDVFMLDDLLGDGPVMIRQHVTPPDAPEGVAALPRVVLHYQMYAGLPVMSKWVTLEMPEGLGDDTDFDDERVTLRGLIVEQLALQEAKAGLMRHFDDNLGWLETEQVSLHTRALFRDAVCGPRAPLLRNCGQLECLQHLAPFLRS